jgi:hypothetical protein
MTMSDKPIKATNKGILAQIEAEDAQYRISG